MPRLQLIVTLSFSCGVNGRDGTKSYYPDRGSFATQGEVLILPVGAALLHFAAKEQICHTGPFHERTSWPKETTKSSSLRKEEIESNGVRKASSCGTKPAALSGRVYNPKPFVGEVRLRLDCRLVGTVAAPVRLCSRGIWGSSPSRCTELRQIEDVVSASRQLLELSAFGREIPRLAGCPLLLIQPEGRVVGR